MKIDIVQEKFVFFINKYKVFINGKLEYSAQSRWFSLMPNIKIYDSNNEWFCDVKEHYGLNRILLNFQVYFRNQSTYEIKSESFLEHNVYTGAEKIDFYEQKRNFIGIFQGDDQIGIISKNKKSYLGGDKYSIELKNESIKPIAVIGFIIAFDNKFKEDNKRIVTVDYGNIHIRPIKEIDKKIRY